MIVFGSIKELTVRRMHLVVILGELDVKIGDPAKLAVNVTLLAQFGVIGHAGALDLVLFVGIELALRMQHNILSILEVLVEVLLEENKRTG